MKPEIDLCFMLHTHNIVFCSFLTWIYRIHLFYLILYVQVETEALFAIFHATDKCRGGSRISGKGVLMYKDMVVRFADFISFFLNIP